MPYTDYDWSKHLDEEAKKAKRVRTSTRELRTSISWNNYSDGSATCANSSYERIYEAYHESKSYEEW